MADKGGVSVLGAMTAAVMDTAPKEAKGPKPTLTALPGESLVSSILKPVPSSPAAFPYDEPTDELRAMLVRLERERDVLTGVIDSIRLLVGDPDALEAAKTRDAETTQKLLEREADRRHADRDAADDGDKKAEARVAAETDPVAPAAARDHKRAIMLDAMKDESFGDRYERLKRDAQDAVYTGSPAVDAAKAAADAGGGPKEVLEAAMAAAGDGWTCPTHGKAITKTSARRGREYQACPEDGCGQFERL